jgi:hypothetical protein
VLLLHRKILIPSNKIGLTNSIDYIKFSASILNKDFGENSYWKTQGFSSKIVNTNESQRMDLGTLMVGLATLCIFALIVGGIAAISQPRKQTVSRRGSGSAGGASSSSTSDGGGYYGGYDSGDSGGCDSGGGDGGGGDGGGGDGGGGGGD